MKISRALLSLFASVSAAAALQAQTPPFLETASLSFLRAFVQTGVSSTSVALPPITPGSPGPIDPDSIKPGDRITTDNGAPVYHSQIGDQSFWVRHAQRSVLERIALQQRAVLRDTFAVAIASIDALKVQIDSLEDQIADTSDPDAREALVTQLENAQEELSLRTTSLAKASADRFKTGQLFELDALLVYAKGQFDDQGARWELTAVRAPQRSVAAAARTPYSIFLSRIERTRSNPTRTFDTGLRLQPYFAVGSSVETLNPGGVIRATGNYTTHFEILFDHDLSPETPLTSIDFEFAQDPLHLVAKEQLALAEAGVDYNKNLVRTESFGSGYMTYSLRSTPGPLAAVTPTKISITGHGSWSQTTETIDEDGVGTVTDMKGGVAPFGIKMSDAKFQSSSLFPDFLATLP